MKLFMVYLGGSAGLSNIEVHDVRFVLGNEIGDTIPALKQQWYGNQHNLHIDCYMHVHHIDGYKISIQNTPSNSGLKLYFVNLGGYQPGKFTELHEFGLFVAQSPEDAKQQAKAKLLKNADIPHKDNLMDVDDCFPVDLFDGTHFVHLEPSPGGQQLTPDWYGYKVI